MISKCKNFGDLIEILDKILEDWNHGCFGGIVGGSGIGYKLEYCINNGNIETSSYWIGGLTGDLKGIIIESENNASVKGETNVGGLVGLVYENGIIKDSKNFGEVNAKFDYGNIYGRNLKTENDNIINCGEEG